LLLIPANAFAAGGTCPSGTNYLNAQTNTFGTLASLGVTSCYFISAAGADTNNGTSESTPWLHAPGMPNCSNTCAGVIPAAGNGFIFRGGDAWHFGNSGASPYTGGTWTLTHNGSNGSPIYFGSDPGWYSGDSWARPVLNADNPLSTSTTLSSCSYQVGSSNILIQLSGLHNLTFDNFETLGLCESALNDSETNAYFRYGYSYAVNFQNLYIHGWTHLQFSCSGTTGLCFDLFAFEGGDAGEGNLPDDTLAYDVVDGSDSDPTGLALIYADAWTVYGCVFTNAAQIVTRNQHLWHDNIIQNWYDPGDGQAHGNVWESVGDAPSTNAFYNNIVRNISPNGVGQVVLAPQPQTGYTSYFFNWLVYGTNAITGNYFNVGSNISDRGTYVIFNNIFEMDTSGSILGCANTGYTETLVAANNLYIDNAADSHPSCTGKSYATFTTDLLMSQSTASSQGYTSSETYAYSPSSASGGTVGIGTNETAGFCAALSAAAASDSTLSDAATACQSDTRYACTYNSSNHTVTCPARTVVPRPSSGAWDVGAYQFVSSTVNPPTNLTATTH